MKKNRLNLEVAIETDQELQAARAYLNRQAELLSAARQLFSTPDSAGRWLVEFLHQGRDEIVTRWETRFLFEAAAFSEISGERGFFISIDDLRKMRPEPFADLAASYRKWIVEAIRRGGPWKQVVELTFQGGFQIDWTEGGPLRWRFRSKDIPTAFQLGIVEIVNSVPIRICARPDCERFFVVATRGKYCSAKCANLQRTRRFEQNLSKEDLAARRHKYYLNREKTKARSKAKRPA